MDYGTQTKRIRPSRRNIDFNNLYISIIYDEKLLIPQFSRDSQQKIKKNKSRSDMDISAFSERGYPPMLNFIMSKREVNKLKCMYYCM